MSSLTFHHIYHKQIIKQNPNYLKMTNRISGKEKDLHFRHSWKRNQRCSRKERASASASGSITIEAALAIPFFFFAALCLIYMLEIMSVQMAVRTGMHYAGKQQAEEMYPASTAAIASLEADIVKAIGTERLNRSIIVGGSSGIRAAESTMFWSASVLRLVVTYEVQLPIPFFPISGIPCREEMTIKGWTGYVNTGYLQENEETVYVTETGLVYHKSYQCTYLDLSIQMVPMGSVTDLRNQSQGRYYPCERCGGGSLNGAVYITNTGDRYHAMTSCSGLKRSVYAIPLSEAIGKGACSRCGQ